MKHIIKRGGHSELYDVRKLYASVFASCVSVRESVGSAELVADKVCKEVETWLKDRHEVTSSDVRRTAAKHLEAFNPDAAYIYTHHRDFI